ncbi:MAG: hypothetical protein AVDCRST_MAG69-505, partial [uncultured Solirubrobacteraceae bacterium]
EVPAHASGLWRAADRRGRRRARRRRAAPGRGVPPPAAAGHVGRRADHEPRGPSRGRDGPGLRGRSAHRGSRDLLPARRRRRRAESL